MPDFSLEETAAAEGFFRIAGVDEAGRGPWAGPVVAGAVVFERAGLPDELRNNLDDSKKLSAPRREALFEVLTAWEGASIGVGIAEREEIDRLNILQATLLAMGRALGNLGGGFDFALVDGNQTPDISVPARAIKKGDMLSLSIAAASIVAKVTRDRIMADLARTFPQYGWERNAGYGTAEHQAALKGAGVSPHHRRSFRPVRLLLETGDQTAP